MCESSRVPQSERYSRIASELVRALRGRRTQVHLSRRLGYRSNALQTWEAGAAFPPASRAFVLAECVGVDLRAGLLRFYRELPPPLVADPLTTPAGISALIRELKGTTRIGALTEASGLSRFSISRWLAGKGQPNLPDLLCFVEHASLRLPDFVALLTDPAQLPTMAGTWRQLQAARALGYERPGAHAVLRALETRAYEESPGVATIARLTGMPPAQVEEDLALLFASDQVYRQGGRYLPGPVQAVDFRREPAQAQGVKAYWARLAAERAANQRPGLCAFNVFAVSRADLSRLVELQRAYLREMRTIIAKSQPSEVVALSNIQLLSLEEGAEEPS